ncbi:hypothetical protein ARNL5_02078 [Anaerolineae bacterium]|nr:hypothetical protein ARNL5_02078 [Anaerolineae bacterium]
MGKNRLFVPQALMDQWLGEGRVEVEGETLITRPEGQRFQLTTAVLFKSEVAGGGDPAQLLGRVKDLDQLAAIGAEHYADSVILGDSAYQVVEGFAGTPVEEEESAITGHDLAAATLSAVGESSGSGEIDLLARFLKSR